MPDITYTPFNADWKDTPDTTTPITAASLEHIESGVSAVTTQANTALSTATGKLSQATADTLYAPIAGYAKAVKVRYVTTGNITPPTDGSWAALSGFEISATAAVDDLISIDVGVMWNPNSSSAYDLAVIVGSSLVRFASSGGATPGDEGAVWFYPQTSFARASGTWTFKVASGDLDSGSVRIVLAHKGANSGTLYASTSYPFYWKLTRERGSLITVL